MSHRRGLGAALIGFLLAGCAAGGPPAGPPSAAIPSVAAPSTIQAVLPAQGRAPALAAEVTDRTGKLLGVEGVEAGMVEFEGRGFLLSEPHAPEALHLDWTGGACDARVRFLLTEGDAGVHVRVATEEQGDACPAVGIPRAIRFVFSEPVVAGGVDFE